MQETHTHTHAHTHAHTHTHSIKTWTSLVARTLRSLPATRETPVQSLGQILWRRKWQPIPVFLPGKSNGWRSLAGYSPWGCRVGHDWVTSLLHACQWAQCRRHTHTHTHRVLRHARKWMSVWEDMNHTRENLEKILSVTAIFVIAWWGTTVNKTMKFLLTVYRGQCGKAVCPAGHPGVSLWFSGVWL